MAIIALVAGSMIGLLYGVIGLIFGLDVGAALLVWLLSGNAASLILFRVMRRGTVEHSDCIHDEVLVLREAEARQAALAISDASTVSRLFRHYAAQQSRAASARANRRMGP